MPNRTSFTIPLTEDIAQVRVTTFRDQKTVTRFTVQLEAFYLNMWKPVRRHDSAHGQPHIDVIDRLGRQRDKFWLDCTNNEALTRARADFNENWDETTSSRQRAQR